MGHVLRGMQRQVQILRQAGTETDIYRDIYWDRGRRRDTHRDRDTCREICGDRCRYRDSHVHGVDRYKDIVRPRQTRHIQRQRHVQREEQRQMQIFGTDRQGQRRTQ